MGKGSAPSAPDPYASAAAQYQYGTQAAAYNTALQRPNVVTPYGSTMWTATPGSAPGDMATGNQGMPYGGLVGGPGGDRVMGDLGGGGPAPSSAPPQYTETQTLSPEQQALLTQRQGTTLTAGQGAKNALGTPLPTVGQNQDFGAEARKAAYGFDTSTMDPYWKEQERQTDSSLRNAGATPGTPAYDNAMTQFHTQRDQAYAQARDQAFSQGLNAQGQQISQIGQLRDIPLNEYTALSGGAQAAGGAPGATGGGAGAVNAPDIASLFQNQYQGNLAGYNADVGTQNAEMSTLGTLLGAIIASDERVKKDVKPIQAKTARGNPLYTYRYNFQSKNEPKQVGVIAQEVERRTPEAVMKDARGMRYIDPRRV